MSRFAKDDIEALKATVDVVAVIGVVVSLEPQALTLSCAARCRATTTPRPRPMSRRKGACGTASAAALAATCSRS
jgi:hypothetical protein